MTTKNNESERVFDVAKPGKKGPDATSRPVIVGHKNMIEDPMVKQAEAATKANGKNKDENDKPAFLSKEVVEDEGVAPHEAKTINPPDEIKDAKQSEIASEPEAMPDDSAQTPVDNDQSGKADTEETQASDSVPDDDTATDLPTAAEATDKPKDSEEARKQQKADEEEKAKQAAIQKLIASKQYNVKVGEIKHKRGARRGLAALIVILLLAAVTVALLLAAGFKLPLNGL